MLRCPDPSVRRALRPVSCPSPSSSPPSSRVRRPRRQLMKQRQRTPQNPSKWTWKDGEQDTHDDFTRSPTRGFLDLGPGVPAREFAFDAFAAATCCVGTGVCSRVDGISSAGKLPLLGERSSSTSSNARLRADRVVRVAVVDARSWRCRCGCGVSNTGWRLEVSGTEPRLLLEADAGRSEEVAAPAGG